MNTASRLYRITPAGSERPNHYVDSHASVLAKLEFEGGAPTLEDMDVGSCRMALCGSWVDRIA